MSQAFLLSTIAAGAIAVVSLGSLAFELLFRDRARISRRIQEEFRVGIKSRVRRSSLFKHFNEASSDSSAENHDFLTRVQSALDQSGLKVSPEQLLFLTYGAVLGCCAAGLLLGRHWLGAVAGGFIGLIAPWLYVAVKRRARLKKLYDQLPDTFELMSRAVRAGQTMTGALQLIATECKPPIAEEFACCCEQQNLGLPQEATFRELARRSGIMELKMFAVALLVQRQSGGSPVELLDTFSQLMRKRTHLKEKVRALTSEGRLQAIVLCVLPIVAFAAIFVLNKTYAQVLLDRPKLLLGILGAQLLGAIWIRKVVNFDY